MVQNLRPRTVSIFTGLLLSILALSILCVSIFDIDFSSFGSRVEVSRQFPSHSIAYAKKYGTFVCEVGVMPNPHHWEGKSVTVEEAWLECKSDTEYSVCMKIVEGRDFFVGSNYHYYYSPSKKLNLGTRVYRQYVLCYTLLDNPDISKIRVRISQGDRKDDQDITFQRK